MLRQGSLRDERRRRSLLEDASAAADDGARAKPRRTSKASEAYTELARTDCHVRWSDFVPLRNWTVAAFLAAGLAPIAALEAAYHFVSQTELWTTGELLALDLARADSLAGWFVTLVLFAAAALSLFVYSVRRCRLDDYRGRYRVWLWGSGMWLVMSIDAAADLRGAAQAACVALSGRVGPLGGVAWWLAPWSLLVAWLGVRMVLDMVRLPDRDGVIARWIGAVAGGPRSATSAIASRRSRAGDDYLRMLAGRLLALAFWARRLCPPCAPRCTWTVARPSRQAEAAKEGQGAHRGGVQRTWQGDRQWQ